MHTSVGIAAEPTDRTGFFGQSAAADVIAEATSSQTLNNARTVSKQ